MRFRLTRGISDAGWLFGVGDALRGMGAVIAVLMLDPRASEFRGSAGGLFRIRIGARVSILEHRAHGTPTGRCSRGRWERLDSGPTPRDSKGWVKLARFWRWYAREYFEGRIPEYSWETASSKDFNRCHTRVTADAIEPRPVAARPHRCHRLPSRLQCFGHAPATGRGLTMSDAEREAERLHNIRVARRDRHALRRLA